MCVSGTTANTNGFLMKFRDLNCKKIETNSHPRIGAEWQRSSLAAHHAESLGFKTIPGRWTLPVNVPHPTPASLFALAVERFNSLRTCRFANAHTHQHIQNICSQYNHKLLNNFNDDYRKQIYHKLGNIIYH